MLRRHGSSSGTIRRHDRPQLMRNFVRQRYSLRVCSMRTPRYQSSRLWISVAAGLLGFSFAACRNAPPTSRQADAARRDTLAVPVPGARPGLKAVRVNGTVLNYRDTSVTGAAASFAPPIVLVHGTLMDLDEWSDQLGPFAATRRTVSYSRRYHPPNPQVDDGEVYSAVLHADDLAALLRALGLAPVDLVGASYGGLVALELAARHPELVHALVLVEPAALGLLSQTPKGDSLRRAALAKLDPVRAALARGDSAGAIATFVSGVSGAPGGFAAMPAPLQAYFVAHAFEFRREMAAPPDLWMPRLSCVDLGQVRMPVLLLQGERTSPLNTRTVDEVARCLPTARLVTIAGARHGVPRDAPAATAFNRAVLDFLKANAQ
jgi:pimeloyl-ACP methyl ester carboxylesterase